MADEKHLPLGLLAGEADGTQGVVDNLFPDGEICHIAIDVVALVIAQSGNAMTCQLMSQFGKGLIVDDGLVLVDGATAMDEHGDGIINNACRLTQGGRQAYFFTRRDGEVTLGVLVRNVVS